MTERPTNWLLAGFSIILALIGSYGCSFLGWMFMAGMPPFQDTRHGVGGLAVSPDGKKVVLVTNLTGRGDLYQINMDGTGLKRLTHHDQPECQPHFSSDGKHLVYTRVTNRLADLWMMNADGSNPHPLMSNNNDDGQPQFVNRHLIAFTRVSPSMVWSVGNPKASEIWTFDLDTGLEKRVTNNKSHELFLTSLAFPQSIMIIRDRLWLHDLKTGLKRDVGPGRFGSLSPLGTQWAEQGNAQGPMARSLIISPWDGTKARTVYTSIHGVSAPVFLPDGSGLLFYEGPWNTQCDLRHLDLATGKTRTILTGNALIAFINKE